ncbi:MAG: site-2 protease family protein [Eubacterium sp.]|nr:site-2 protease family protein [Eubacterium sp.]
MFSLISLIRSGDTLGAIVFILSGCFVVFVCSPVHELSHAFAAYKLGDDTAKREGRLTFNPLKHIDPIGMIMILLFGFGYAKPVPVNFSRLNNPKRDGALVALAGPASNIVMSFIFGFLYTAVNKAYTVSSVTALEILAYFFYFAAYINIALAVFNLLPIPPLDGSKILAGILPDKLYWKYMQYERYAMIVVLVLLFTNILNRPLLFLESLLMRLVLFVPNLIFG